MAWFEALTLMERVFLFIAAPATLLLLIQLVIQLIGLGADTSADMGGMDAPDTSGLGDMDAPDVGMGDASGTIDASGAGALQLFSIWGILAFFTMFGWTGLLFAQSGLAVTLTLMLALVCGFVAMAVIALLLRTLLRLQDNGVLDIRNAIGRDGSVYLTIPAARAEGGKVMVMVQERLTEFEAITEEAHPIPTGTLVRVKGVISGNTLVVVPRADAQGAQSQAV